MSRRERQRRRRRKRGAPLKRVLVMTFLVTVCGIVLAALALAGWVVAVADSAPNISQMHPRVPGQLSEVFAADGSSLGYIYAPDVRLYVAGGRIPQLLKDATVAIEDRRFYHHGALDYQGILRAGIKDVFSGGSSLQGASTLTMQLIDNEYLDGTKYSAHHNLKYKIVQAKLAEQLEGKHSKGWILDNYLNDVPYGTVNGQTAYGVQAASELFFDKPVWQLSLAQEALLAGLPQAPSEYNPFIFRSAALARRSQVLAAMVASHYISRAQAQAARRERLGTRHNNSYSQRSLPYVFDYVVQQLNQRLCPHQPATHACGKVDEGGLKIYSTIDPTKEREAEQVVWAHQGVNGQPAAALTSIDPSNGHILAIANSSAYTQTKFDYATQAHRQPGSAFKVFALMTLIHDYDGDPNQTYYNSHYLAAGWLPAYPTYSVHTAEQSYQGDINITRATITSDNTVFAQLAVDEGMSKFDAIAHAMGITTHLDGNPAEVIGGLTTGVTTLEMADAYSTLADGGQHHPATAIDHVVFPNGRVLNLGDSAGTQVFNDGETSAATDVLKQVITSSAGTGTAANYGCPAAGKTGTAENLANAWFVGYTPKFSTAVWVGYPSGNIPMSNGFGGSLAAPIWHDYMQEASAGYCGDFPSPTTPWHGSAFFGPHATTGKANVGYGSSGGSSQYYNPQLYQQVPQGPPATTPNPTPNPTPTTPNGGNGVGAPTGPGGTGPGTTPGGNGSGPGAGTGGGGPGAGAGGGGGGGGHPGH